MKSSTAKWLIEITSALLILLFIYTALSKLNDKRIFAAVMSQSSLIGAHATILSYIIPLMELIVAVLLFFPSSRKSGLWASLVMMSLFTIYITLMLLFDPELPCSCGGIIKELSWKNHLVFNIIFIILPAVSIRWYYDTNRFIAINRNSRTPV